MLLVHFNITKLNLKWKRVKQAVQLCIVISYFYFTTLHINAPFCNSWEGHHIFISLILSYVCTHFKVLRKNLVQTWLFHMRHSSASGTERLVGCESVCAITGRTLAPNTESNPFIFTRRGQFVSRDDDLLVVGLWRLEIFGGSLCGKP